MMDCKQVTIIGTGLLGASLALALRRSGYCGAIVGVGRREETLEGARGLGCFSGLTVSTAEALAEARALPGDRPHLAVLAAPLGHFEEIFRKLAPCDDPGLIVTDVGSTKVSVCSMAQALLPSPQRFVGSHPMAGSEQQGPSAADAALFDGKPCILTTDDDTDPAAVALVESLWRSVGMNIVRMTAKQHDEQTAAISHLPHAAAALLVQVAHELGGWEIASTGFKDTTRLASSNPPMRVDILTANKAAVITALDAYQAQIERLRSALAGDDQVKLLEILEQSKQLRDRWLEEKEK